MQPFTLQLTHRNPREAPGSLDGWLVPGKDVEQWIRMLCQSGLSDLHERPLFILPESNQDREPGGLFVPCPINRLPGRALSYSLLGSSVYVPSEACFDPPLNDGEFASLFLQDINLYHPRLGLVGFDLSEAIYLKDLVALPEIRHRAWNRAHPGLLPLPKRLSVTAEPPTRDLRQMLSVDKGDIGTASPKDIPPMPGEKSGKGSGQGRGKGQGGNGFFRAVKRFTQMFPEGGTEQTWLNRLEDWADSKMASVQNDQNREVDRLLQLFEDDPDKGLRYALPIGGEEGRGYTDPTTQLGERDVDFQLGKLGGGGPISPWILDHSQTQRLMQTYRNAANRELQLGRHRRAAYIFAHLLGDFVSAANALKAGGYYREAAVVYQEKLKNDSAAAQCLKDGGLYEDALVLYKKLGEPETVAQLHALLGQHDQALAAYEEAVNLYASKQDHLRAANLLEEKLQEPKRALEMLLLAWPDSRQSDACLREHFKLHNRLGSFEEATATVRDLRDDTPSPEASLKLAEILSDASQHVADLKFQEVARDAARVVIGRQLCNVAPGEKPSPRALKTLWKLDQTDHLLRNDARQFAKSRPALPTPPPLPPDAQNLRLKIAHRTEFRGGFRIWSAARLGNGFVAAGYLANKPAVLRYSDQAPLAYSIWTEGTQPPFRPILIHPLSETRPVQVGLITQQDFPDLSVEAHGEAPRVEFKRTAHGTLGQASDDAHGIWTLTYRNTELLLTRTDSAGNLTATHHMAQLPVQLTPEFIEASGFIAPMNASHRSLCLALANMLIHLGPEKLDWYPMSSHIGQLIASPPHTRPRFALSMEEGAAIIWADRGWDQPLYLAEEASRPKLAFTRSGHFIVADKHKVQIFSLENDRATLRCSVDSPFDPAEVLPGPQVDQFWFIGHQEAICYTIRSERP